MGLFSFLFIYFLGFLSSILIIPITLYYFAKDVKDELNDDSNSNTDLKAGEIEEKHQSGLESYKNGWIIVTNNYIESTDDINKNTTSITETPENKSAYSSLFKIVNKEQQQREQELINNPTNEEDDLKDDNASIHSIQPSIVTNNSTPIPQNKSTQSSSSSSTINMRQSLKKHRYFAVLKHGNLFLYKDQTLKDVKHVIVLNNFYVKIWPEGLTDAQLFTKYTAIALINISNLKNNKNQQSNPIGSFYIYCDMVSDKEDWYFALIRSSKSENLNKSIPFKYNPKIFANTLHFSTKEIINLIQSLYGSEGNLQTKWLNALIGRWFLAIKDTKYFENYIHTRLSKKLDKIKKPGFFEEFQITNINPGSSAPFFTYPNLKEINPDGTLVVNGNISYNGGLSVTIATKLDLSFGTKFTKGEVDIVLKITLVNLDGSILIKLKPPPSNRFWYCYEVEPNLNFKIEPVVSTKSLNYSFITSTIEKKFKEAIKESLVLPHWDDIVFFDTTEESYRGGIWKVPEINDDSLDDQQSSEENDSKSILDEQSTIDSKINLTSNNQNKYSKLSKNITDFTKKIKKKSSTPSTEDFENTTITPNQSNNNNNNESNSSPSIMSNTFKKIGKWYFKEDKNSIPSDQNLTEKSSSLSIPQKPNRSNSNSSTKTTGSSISSEQQKYHPPEMISNRRPPRKSSSASANILKTNDKISTHNNDSGNNSPTLQYPSNFPPTTNTGLSTTSPPALNSPSFNFSKFDHSNIDLPPLYQENDQYGNGNGNGNNNNNHNNNHILNSNSSSIKSPTITAAQLAASKSFNSLNNLSNNTNKKRTSSISSSSTLSFATTNNNNHHQEDSTSTSNTNEIINSAHLVSEPTLGIAQPTTPIRSKTTTIRKPPPKSPVLEPKTNSINIDLNTTNNNNTTEF
ncbi:uncharacterized protein KGF55_002071 [Candida pseudojiufengensis]|uniref:uncharacterized protein n=1 Tax=Candida pseudojiufengensis TaxID=497109 RepID=UPI002225350D|nr:uncharacterized protein KGF55_002071 [Candida pseudojiufengensis]KAI5964129.1 hypothetical protein KGF55_002071 [Candida pseudojiufengensis]